MAREREEMTVVHAGTMTLLLPRPGLCPQCASDHKADEPHNADSLYYQMAFHRRHGRFPTWTDAVGHCTPEVREAWLAELRDMGVEVH